MAALWFPAAASARQELETVFRFTTPDCEGHMSVQFMDGYSSKGFWFGERISGRRFCLSGKGDEGKNCMPQFAGSIAIAIYHFQPRRPSGEVLKLTERVISIDHDIRTAPRPPYERVLEVRQETASDIQAFGYNPDHPPEPSSTRERFEPWCLLRQDLFLNVQPSPFLTVHWKHTLNAISLIDVIPGDNTQITRA